MLRWFFIAGLLGASAVGAAAGALLWVGRLGGAGGWGHALVVAASLAAGLAGVGALAAPGAGGRPRRPSHWAGAALGLAVCAALPIVFRGIAQRLRAAETPSVSRSTEEGPLRAALAADELQLDRQTRRVVGGAGAPHAVDVPPDADRILVGYAVTAEPTPGIRLVARGVAPGPPRELSRTEVHATAHLPRWQDWSVDLPAGAHRPSRVEIAFVGPDGGPPPSADTLVLSRPTVLRPRAGSRPRNLVLLSIDTLRADRLGAYGYREHPTSPGLDALARRGTLFERVFAPSNWTVPGHVAMLAGVHPDAVGMDREVFATPRLPDGITTLAELFSDAGTLAVAFTGTGTMRARNGLAQGFHLYQEAYSRPGGPILGDLDNNLANARRWLEQRPERPLFLFLHTFEVHAPYVHTRFASMEYEGRQEESARYASGIAYTDERLARFVEELDAQGLLEDSLLVVTSDHGEGLWTHREIGHHGKYFFDELLHVPLLVVGPGFPAQRISAQVPLLDLYATLVDVFGLPLPDGADSRSLRPLVEGRESADRPVYLCCWAHDEQDQGLRADELKYWYRPRPAGDEEAPAAERLYDLARDPGETENLAASRPELAERLRARTAEWTERHRARAERLLGERARSSAAPDPEYIEQLRALGYVE